MTHASEVYGVIPALITPFDKNEKIAMNDLATITEYLVKGGVHALMPVGGTGEFPHLLREEKKDVIAAVASIAKGIVPIIAGTAACSTREVILLCNDAVDAGADVVIITAPYYFKLPEHSLIEHYKNVAENISCPIVVYNNPLYTGNNMSPQLIARLLQLERIIGVKQSNSDLGQLVELIRLAPEGNSLCTGIDSQFYASLCVGASGIYSTAAGVVPATMVKLYDLYKHNMHTEALALHKKLQAINRYLEYDPGYIAPAKEALNILGLPGGSARAPMPVLTDDEKKGLQKALKLLDVL